MTSLHFDYVVSEEESDEILYALQDRIGKYQSEIFDLHYQQRMDPSDVRIKDNIIWRERRIEFLKNLIAKRHNTVVLE